MKPIILTGLLLATCLPTSAVSATSPLENEIQGYAQRIDTDKKDGCSTAALPLAHLISERRFKTLKAPIRAQALSALLECVMGQSAAVGLAMDLEPIATTSRQIGLADIRLASKDYTDGRASKASSRVVRIAQTEPALLNMYSLSFLSGLLTKLNDPSDKKALLKVLMGVTWGDETWGQVEKQAMAHNGWAYQYAKLLLQDGDIDGARATLQTVNDPFYLTQTIPNDPVFTPLLPELELQGRLNKDAQYRADIESARALIKKFPNYLGPHTQLMQGLTASGEAQEAVDIGLALMARIEAGEEFVDNFRLHAWIGDYISKAYIKLGKKQEAMAALETATRSPYSTVSQILNLASMQVDNGKKPEALANVDKALAIGASPYGKMVAYSVKVCAIAESDPVGAQATLKLMVPLYSYKPDGLKRALKCMNYKDEDAADYMDKLAENAQAKDR